ncbi:MAG: hypothetical protein AAF358_07890 [Pseudomonadota bacterium]
MNKCFFSLGVAGTLLLGCASQPELPRSDLTVKAVFESVAPIEPQPIEVSSGATDLRGFTRNAANELQQLFPKLPNPTLLIYVVPHRSGGLPVPGYMTAISMYTADPFGLPGEWVGVSGEVQP